MPMVRATWRESTFAATSVTNRRRRLSPPRGRGHDGAMSSLGRRFAKAVAAKDVEVLREVLAADVDFKGVTSGRLWESQDADGVLEVVLGSWFAEQDVIDRVVEIREGDPVEDTHHVAYRFAISTPDGPHTAEQQAYYRGTGEQISHLRVICSGFRPVAG